MKALARSRKALALIAVGILAAIGIALGVTAATASVPDSSGMIHACYTTSSGALRIIDTDAGGACYSYETAISWPSSTPTLKYFAGTATATLNGSSVQFTVTCTDGGVPANIFVNDGNDGNYRYPNSVSAGGPYLHFSNSVPDGFTVPEGTSGSSHPYVLICS
ncbi:MAG TPA: hypothetical protein VGL39_27950 [Jatrophihabitantaceae bacterium]|jgi:hypothetical protein